ncbi:MAG: tRNA (N(6)-L-threonylcarbamoyladenosine(37)-C(2))-methylthiotransferase MtaB [Planctomycetes bacterium]|nr:tRNA (N(6)-L-threonylcarbamoyladenosine(37)-C(2))-methylthiotransferase MtaB [Planctomycetota bacterium]
MPRCAFITFGCKVNQWDTQAVREALARLGCDQVPPTAEADLYVVNTCCVTRESHRKGLQAIRRLARQHPHARIVVTGCSAETDAAALRAMPGVACVLGNDAKPLIANHVARLAGPAVRLVPAVSPPSAPLLDKPAVPHAALESPRQGSGTAASPSRVPSLCTTAGQASSATPLRDSTGIAPVWPEITRFEGHTRAFVKIEDGCNDFCAYCIVPHVRGRVRSRPPGEVVAEVARLVGNGYLEIVLTGIHLGCYGLDAQSSSSLVPRPRFSGCDLVSLVERLLATPGLRRLRLSSLELREVSDELIALAAASPLLCPHFHIPLQSGDDEVLRTMNRRYTAADFLRRLDALRARIPDPAVTTDLIVGFPGETDAQFRRTLDVARQAAFSRIHVFPYSDRPGTSASRMSGNLSWATIKTRRDEMKAVAADLSAAYHRRFVGRTVEPLVESRRDPRTGLLVGYTERYVRTLLDGPDALCGTIAPVRVVAATPAALRGETPLPAPAAP